MALRSIYRWIRKRYLRIITSIAFIPSLLAIGLFLLSLITLYIDETYPEQLISYALSVTNLIHPDSARALLSAITGGMISLMVFSFSMVMIVLSQTAANYSPRALPSLIGRRFHQIVMGTYLGTILYTIVVLSSIQSSLYAFQVPHLSIVLTVVFGLTSLTMFIAFIHSMSQHIQIGNIIRNLHHDTLKSLNHYLGRTEMIPKEELPSAQPWLPVNSPVSGYLHGVDQSALVKFSAKAGVQVWMAAPWGNYMHEWQTLFRVSRQLTEAEQQTLLTTFIFESEEIISQNYAYGFKQLTEIAVKALSPGINDPGTAVEAMDRLTSLFVCQMNAQDIPVFTDSQGRLRWIGQPVSFEDLFTWCWTAIKNYADQDTVVLYKMIEWLETMVHHDLSHRYSPLLSEVLSDLIHHIDVHVKSEFDQNNLHRRIYQFGQRSPDQALSEVIQAKGKLLTTDSSESV